MQPLTLTVLDQTLAIARLRASEPIPEWSVRSAWCSITNTGSELSIVCPQQNVPNEVASEKGWRPFAVKGPLDFELTGVLASLATPLAAAGISIFAVSTFDTDYLLVKQEQLAAAIETLQRAGHTVEVGTS